jgi:hypothetical protein
VPIKDFNSNRTLFGLRTNTDLVVRYSVREKRIESVSGVDIDQTHIEPVEELAFNVPIYIAVAGVPLFPSTYEIASGVLSYHAHRPPREYVQLAQQHDLNERTKEVRYTVDYKKLTDLNRGNRKRCPAAHTVMRSSASAYVQELIDRGRLILRSETKLAWHWCHLLAFSFLPASRAQNKRNLICGTSAFNGQMASIEAAVKTFVFQFGRSLSLEITATCLADTHFGLRLRYRIFDKYSGESLAEYFDPYGAAPGDYSDCGVVYERLVERFAVSTPHRPQATEDVVPSR